MVDHKGQCLITAAEDSTESDANATPTVELLAYSGGKLFVEQVPFPVVVEVATLTATHDQTPLLLEHKSTQGVGHADSVDMSDNQTVKAVGRLSIENEHQSTVIKAHKAGFKWKPSVGLTFDWKSARFVKAGETITANGQTHQGPLVFATNAKLGEISFVPRGGDQFAAAHIAAAAADSERVTTMKPELIAFITAAGFSHEGLNEENIAAWQKKFDDDAAEKEEATLTAAASAIATVTAAGGDGSTLGGGGADDIILAQRTALAEENQRVADITAACAEFDNPSYKVQGKTVTVLASAISEGWDVARTRQTAELEDMRSKRVAPGGIVHVNAARGSQDALAAAMMLRSGIQLDATVLAHASGQMLGLPDWCRQDINNEARQQVMEAGHGIFERSMYDIAKQCALIDGKTVGGSRTAVIQAAMSGSSLSFAWNTNVAASVLQGFEKKKDTTKEWTTTGSAMDFKSMDKGRLLEMGDLSKHGRGGEAEHTDRSDKLESFKIDRFSRQFSVDEMDIIDDRFSLLSKTPGDFGVAAGRLRPNLVYAILLANAAMQDGTTLFHADRSNLRTGKSLTRANLAAALTAFETQSENGVELDIEATHLIAPRALKDTALQILNSSEVRGTGEINGTTNVSQNSVSNTVFDSRLDNGVVDPDSGTTYAGSTTDWYLASTEGETIEVAYLEGAGEAPAVGSWNSNGENGKWEMGWSIKLDIGAKALESLPLQKNEA